ncbi:MAG: LLM class flavin-dependent oxidoreductase [Gemmatimonas sp.]|nr:LLM class flavin-dependent oxidoreductase [Gemmatimonas sp.]
MARRGVLGGPRGLRPSGLQHRGADRAGAVVQVAAPLRTGIWFAGGQTVGEMADLSEAAERRGVDSVWIAESLLARDAFVALTAIAVSTERVLLGTGIVNPYTRHPSQLAASFSTLDDASGGRALCGIGIGARDGIASLGFDTSRPLAAARESVELIRSLLAREAPEHHGRKFTSDGARLGFKPDREELPVYLAATGPKMCALAGEIADGIYLPCGSEQFLRGAIGQSMERRDPGKMFDVACQALVSVDEDAEAAAARVRPTLGFILTEPNAEKVLESNGLDPAGAQPIRDALGEGGVRAMSAAIGDDIVDALAIAGPPDRCLARLRAMVACGVTHPQASLLGGDPDQLFDVLAKLKEEA